MAEELKKDLLIESFLINMYPDISESTKITYRLKINKYMSGCSVADQYRLTSLLRKEKAAVTAYRKVFTKFISYCKECETNQQLEEVLMADNETTTLPVNENLRKIPNYLKLLECFVIDKGAKLSRKDICSVFYPIVKNKHTHLSYFYTYLNKLGLQDGNFFKLKITKVPDEKDITKDTKKDMEVIMKKESKGSKKENNNTKMVKVENTESKKDLCISDVLSYLSKYVENEDSMKMIQEIVDKESYKKIIKVEVSKFLNSLRSNNIPDDIVENLDDRLQNILCSLFPRTFV